VKLSLKKNKLVNLSKLDSFPNVTYLKLSRNNIGSLSSLSVLANLKSLKGVSLYNNPLAENREEYLRAVHEFCPTLESLDHEVHKGKDADQLSQDTKQASQQTQILAESQMKNSSTPSAGYREGASKRQVVQGAGTIVIQNEPRASSANNSKKPLISESSSLGNPRPTKISKAINSQGGQISIIQAGSSGGFGGQSKAQSVERAISGPNDAYRSESVPQEDNGGDDDDADQFRATQLDGQKGNLSRTANSDPDSIYSMDPKSMDTIKAIFEKKMKDRPSYMTNTQKKDEEIWLGNPNHPIGFYKKASANSYKITGDGLWMMMSTKTVPVKTIEEISFEYVFMDNLRLPSVMAYLSQMKKLKNLRLSFNNMVEYLELVKFEVDYFSYTRFSPTC
jgi:Leucine-rich repeat (LRR) protein